MSFKHVYKRSQSFSSQWEDLSASVDFVLNEHEGQQERRSAAEDRVKQNRAITNHHWVDSKLRNVCGNTQCEKKFTLTDRKIHCRRCGEVFCTVCTQYQLHLSPQAIPDYNGKTYKVCISCYEDVNHQGTGATISHTGTFLAFRNRIIKSPCSHVQGTVDILAECRRLTEGFMTNVGSSSVKSTVGALISPVKTQDWQKSKNWIDGSLVKTCSVCVKKFTVISRKIHCRVCGHVVCTSCSNGDLLLYSHEGATKWTIIRIIGCPETEPNVCMYLWVCNCCHKKLSDIQVDKYQVDSQCCEDFFDGISSTYHILMTRQQKLDHLLPKYGELVEALESKSDHVNNLLPQGSTITQTLAKYYTDISDLFSQFAVDLQAFRRNKPKTSVQMHLLTNVTKSRCSFYSDNLWSFRQWKAKLFEILPIQVLEGVQAIVDKDTINSTYIIIRQLAMEALLLADKHLFDYTVMQIIASAEEVCLKELKLYIENLNQNWEEHNDTLKKYLPIRLKENRLVKPSKRKTQAEGAKYVESFLIERSNLNLRKVIRQLEAKSADKQFLKTKAAVGEALQKIRDMKDDQLTV